MGKTIKNVVKGGKCQWTVRRRNLHGARMVLLAVLSSLTVVFDVVCTHTLPLHAGTAMVVITGASLGPMEGLICGGISRLVCNFFNGQGMWTLWQMGAWGLLGAASGWIFYPLPKNDVKNIRHAGSFCLGLITAVLTAGLIAGVDYIFTGKPQESFLGYRIYFYGGIALAVFLLFKKKLPRNPYTLFTVTFLFTFIFYGGIMNFASMVLSRSAAPEPQSISLSALRAVYITGVPYDFFHALSAAFMAFFFGMEMIRKIDHAVKKFGL